MIVTRSKIKGERLISSPSTARMGGEKHWLLVLKDSTHHVWSCFLKGKSGIKDGMMALIKDLKTKQEYW